MTLKIEGRRQSNHTVQVFFARYDLARNNHSLQFLKFEKNAKTLSTCCLTWDANLACNLLHVRQVSIHYATVDHTIQVFFAQ